MTSFVFLILARYCQGDAVLEVKMGRACEARRREMYTGCGLANLMERCNLKDLLIDKMVILKLI